MFLEKHSRFFRKYEFTFAGRHKESPTLPLNHKKGEYSIQEALQALIDKEEALEVLPNGDILELMEVAYNQTINALTLLVHRASPDAAEPHYRKRAREAAGKKVSVRKVEKEADEHQSVSAHVVISGVNVAKGVYRAALEEIPGIHMAAIRRLVVKALHEYPYEFMRGKQTIETHSTFKPQGIKSESMTNALKTGRVNFVTLSRPAKPKWVDADGMFKPEQEILKLRVEGSLDAENWKDTLFGLVKKAKADGWADFKVDIDLDDNRSRTVKLDRDEEAAEILFVRAEQVFFETELAACSVDIIDEVVRKALSIAKS